MKNKIIKITTISLIFSLLLSPISLAVSQKESYRFNRTKKQIAVNDDNSQEKDQQGEDQPVDEDTQVDEENKPPAQKKDQNSDLDENQPTGDDVESRTIKEETEEEELAFETIYERDPDMEEGDYRVGVEGENGLQVITYEVVYVNGEPVSKTRIGPPQIIRPPVDQVIYRGTKPRQEEKMGEAKLKFLMVNGAELDKKFDPDILTYKLIIDKDAKEIEFIAGSENSEARVEGLRRIDPSTMGEHKIKVVLDNGESTEYSFSWEFKGPIVFRLNDSEGREHELYYDDKAEFNLGDLEPTEFIYKGIKLKSYKDSTNNVIVPIRSDEAKFSGWYKINSSGLVKKVDNPVAINKTIYYDVPFFELDSKLQNKYKLTLMVIEGLNIEGYSTSISGNKDLYIVRLGKLDGEDFWYKYNKKDKTLEKLDFSDIISESDLEKYFKEEPIISDKNKLLYIGIGIVIINMLAIAGYFIVKFFKKRKDKKDKENNEENTHDELDKA